MLVDTHCHIQDTDYPLDKNIVLENALNEGVDRVVVVGTDIDSSKKAIELASEFDQPSGSRAEVYAVIGVHPSAASTNYKKLANTYHNVAKSKQGRIIGVGEIGLDYHYPGQSRNRQIEALEWQIDFALKHDLPIEFHVRDAYDDFWSVIDNFDIKKADLHSFTDSQANVEEGLKRGFYIGLNGISTFTKIGWQKKLYNSLPLDSILLETDAPFLTPAPYRGKVNEPARIKQIASYHAAVRGISLETVAEKTSHNFERLFGLADSVVKK